MIDPMPTQEQTARLAERREQLRVTLAGCGPAHTLRDLLSFYRDGRDGKGTGRSFADAWQEALPRACATAADDERTWWLTTLTEQCAAWRRAYERADQLPRERALVALLYDPERVELVPSPRVCALCGGDMEGRVKQARYCCPEHERAAARKRKAVHCTPRDQRTLTPARESSRVGAGV